MNAIFTYQVVSLFIFIYRPSLTHALLDGPHLDFGKFKLLSFANEVEVGENWPLARLRKGRIEGSEPMDVDLGPQTSDPRPNAVSARSSAPPTLPTDSAGQDFSPMEIDGKLITPGSSRY